jgi:hypothetical protein
VAVLHAIPDRERHTYATFRGLSRRFAPAMGTDRLRDELQQLLAGRFIVSPKRNAFQRVNGWLPLHERLVAVELKLTRFSEAMTQAVAHLAFAPESYVAMPQPLADRLASDVRGSRLASAGLGLLAVNLRECSVLIPASGRQEEIDPVLQLAFIERFWKSHFTNSSA